MQFGSYELGLGASPAKAEQSSKKGRVASVSAQPMQTLWECYQLEFSAAHLQQGNYDSQLYLG